MLASHVALDRSDILHNLTACTLTSESVAYSQEKIVILLKESAF
jgi:hypothetical protein